MESSDTLLMDHLIHGLDSTISDSTHRRLRSKQANTQQSSVIPPLLVTLGSQFDQTKLLSLALRLKSHPQFKSVFIKRALTSVELQEVSKLRKLCEQANSVNTSVPRDFKYLILDGKIRCSKYIH